MRRVLATVLAAVSLTGVLAFATPAQANAAGRELPPSRSLCTTETTTTTHGRVTETRQLTTCPNGYHLLVTKTLPNGKTAVVKEVNTIRILPRR